MHSLPDIWELNYSGDRLSFSCTPVLALLACTSCTANGYTIGCCCITNLATVFVAVCICDALNSEEQGICLLFG